MKYEAIVVGAGHAGVEAALALARLGHNTLIVTLSERSVSHMACNPNVGGTGKGHLVREVDALGGQMGLNADSSLLQIKMLNKNKGAAVQSLRGQTDKEVYHQNMLATLRAQKNLTILEGECEDILVEKGKITGVVVSGEPILSDVVVLCTGVYLSSRTITGEEIHDAGPYGFENSKNLSSALLAKGLPLRRFKTGTPARVYADSIDYSVMEKEDGDYDINCFSFLTEGKLLTQTPCYLTYTNAETHRIIRENIDRAPLYNGTIHGVGPRYCPSIEDKIMRFADKERHQVFIEPEVKDGELMYVQGMSSSLPKDVQEKMYRTIKGLENVRFARYAYAIEYDCIDPLALTPALAVKAIDGLFSAGQFNGSSGYEEAAAQGLMAGINAARKLENKAPVVLRRDEAYIGVLIDDLVTKGTNEPYRMMTARAEYRLSLRQDNADARLTPLGREIGLVDDYRWQKFLARNAKKDAIRAAFKRSVPLATVKEIFESKGETATCGMTVEEMLKRAFVTAKDVLPLLPEETRDPDLAEEVAVEVRYCGYLDKEKRHAADALKMEEKLLPEDLDYSFMENLRLEARQKLSSVRPRTLGQATRISGVSPADIGVLITYLVRNNK
ncbi:MAG: tRNA uridine-5-carboxymethylaminomethyl(34) synthesis enzyme MnmG [Clostridia bacterium]|nr:tRNA uridine-5-carboxymethylaminomethyl(34) synthesis enzyme MnmG [Clostridia bacterium]